MILKSSFATSLSERTASSGILHVRKFHEDAVAADGRDLRLGDAQTVDARVDDLLDLSLNISRNLRHFRTRVQLQQNANSALQIEAELYLALDRGEPETGCTPRFRPRAPRSTRVSNEAT